MIELRRRHSAEFAPSSRLPKGYQEVEYLESTGTQYINLGVSLPRGFIYEGGVTILNRDKTSIIIGAGYDASDGNNRNYLTFTPSTPNQNFIFQIGARGFSAESSINNLPEGMYYVKADSTLTHPELFINNKAASIVMSDGYGKPYCDFSFCLFAYHRGYRDIIYTADNGLRLNGEQKLHNEYGELVRHLIPCYRTSDRVAGMYDIVNDVFYVNQGTGEFLVGPDVGGGQSSILPQDYQLVDWLGNGNDNNKLPYIKTDILPTTTLGFEFECAIPTAAWKESPAYDYLIMGSEVAWNENDFAVGFNNTYSPFFIGLSIHVGSGSPANNATNIQPESDVFGKYKYENGNFYFNNEFIKSGIASLSLPIYLFGVNRNGTALRLQGGIKFKPLLFFDGNKNAIAHFYPCYRKADNVAGMYDIVNGVFHTNAGTGEFIVGPDVIG